jgi:AcrR family transcriptional regulator
MRRAARALAFAQLEGNEVAANIAGVTSGADNVKSRNMAPRKAPLPERRGYHHGNLKEALIAAARALIAERGPAGFALSEAARLAGVSAAAPYRHFKDRDALIAEVARRGFAEFGRRLNAAWTGAEADPKAGFGRMGEAYLAFAREEPGYYGAMFAGGGVGRAPLPGGSPTFGGLEKVIARIVAARGDGGAPSGPDPRVLAYQVWAMSHGIAMLSAAGHIPDEGTVRPDALLRTGVAALLAGSARVAAGSSTSAARKPRKRSPAHRRAGA